MRSLFAHKCALKIFFLLYVLALEIMWIDILNRNNLSFTYEHSFVYLIVYSSPAEESVLDEFSYFLSKLSKW